MDYTLAQYFTAFDQLAFDGAKDKLLQDLGYPQEVDGFEYDPEHFSRGLVIDLERGGLRWTYCLELALSARTPS